MGAVILNELQHSKHVWTGACMVGKGLEGYGPNAGEWDLFSLGNLVGMDKLGRRSCFRALYFFDSMVGILPSRPPQESEQARGGPWNGPLTLSGSFGMMEIPAHSTLRK